VRPLEREVEHVLGSLIEEYPEIAPLVGRRRTRRGGDSFQPDADGLTTAVLAETLHGLAGPKPGPGHNGSVTTAPERPAEDVLDASEEGELRVALVAGKRLGPGLRIGFDDAREREDLGWLLENTVWINRAHPAYRKAASTGNESYHVVLGVVWVLLGHLDDRHFGAGVYRPVPERLGPARGRGAVRGTGRAPRRTCNRCSICSICSICKIARFAVSSPPVTTVLCGAHLLGPPHRTLPSSARRTFPISGMPPHPFCPKDTLQITNRPASARKVPKRATVFPSPCQSSPLWVENNRCGQPAAG
jgi:hypothetical protein